DGGTLFDGETVSLRGAGIATGGAFAFDPPSASFSVYRGQLSDVRSIIATNVDAVPHTVSDVIVGSPFWVNGDNCTLAGPIAPGGTCEIFVYADGALASPGNSTGDVSFTSTAGLAMVPLSVDISPNLAWNPSSQSFPDTPVGGPPTTRTYTLENRDGDPYNISIAIEPYSAPAYSLTGGTCLGGSIPASPDGIVPGTCTLDVQFLPSAGGFQYLYFYAQEQATPQRNYGYGDAFAVSPGPRLSLSPSSLVFPQGARGVPTQLPVSVTNLGDAPTSAAISLASNGAELSFDPGTCATAIPPGGSCVFNVTYLRTANTVGFANIDFVTVQFGALSEYLDVYGTTLDAIPATVEALPAGTSVFPATLVNTDSAPIEFSLANGGTDGSTLAITSIVSSSPEFLVASDCPLGPSTLSSQACCLATVTFHPTAVGTRTGTLTVTTTAGVLVIGLTGEGLLSTPVLTLLPQPPGPLDFGSVTVGSPSSPQVVTVSNTGTGPLTFLGAPALAGDSSKASTAAKSFVIAGDFSQLATTCGASLPPPPDPLSECTTTLVFTPTATGARNGTFTVASDGGIAVLDLTGQGTALPVPDISLSASGLFFPGQTVGTTSLPQPVTVSNAGTAPLVISGVSASGDFAAASDCTALSPLAPLATCGITVTFTPLAPGVRTGSVAIASNDPDTPTATVALEGDGVASPSPNATITPATLSFPSTASRQVSAPLTATLSNTGAAPLAILAIEVVGSGFTATHTCGPSLAMGASCTITAIFAPPSAGSFAADVRIMTNSPAGAAFLRLTGSATAAPVGRLAAIPSTLSFGDQIVGTTSAARPFTVTNVGSAVASVSRITTTGDFAVSGTCADVRPGESCAFLASFSPAAVGSRSGQVLFEVDGATAPFAVALSGNGVPVPAPRVQLSASSLAFGNGLAGVGSTLFVTVTNAGSADLVFGPLMEATGDFRVTANGCTGTLAPSQSCRVDVGFLPSIPGARSGELRFSTNAEGSPHRVALSGNGCRFEVTGRSSALVCGR
ncbi:MAG: choice-of-anchor D domain-containing protein, partial [Burkholderiales bacterium]|nr:choice-of-anchor D domain-containing protein [Burkholderiales bacterium]